ncbi:hypothetical protein QBC40DRAFT_5345 [Triangularia verruculosa]|uniref:Uncharacterized protein n=1 Tax=Triangularia verruculosa TaxID=2587418 RepID=A0AAN7APW6_9PEZI|nr:hypothetical protein QBC40DRAFT_5345 [Triangularia verruculosa]
MQDSNRSISFVESSPLLLGLAFLFGPSAEDSPTGDEIDWTFLTCLTFQILFFWAFLQHCVTPALVTRLPRITTQSRTLAKGPRGWTWVNNCYLTFKNLKGTRSAIWRQSRPRIGGSRSGRGWGRIRP